MNKILEMVTHHVEPGSPEWLELRLKYKTASEAPVIMGGHPNMKRDDLLVAKKTFTPKEFSDYTLNVIFERGHEVEAKARAILEEREGDDLYQLVVSCGEYLSSLDGAPMMEEYVFEHKQWNKKLAELTEANKLPEYIYWQLEHQLLTCPAAGWVLFVVSDGTLDNWVELEYRSKPARRKKLIKGWDQFSKDLDAYEVKEVKPEPIASKPKQLPQILVNISGELTTSSNLKEFRAGADKMIAAIKPKLTSDQDFADAGETIKYLKAAEERIEVVKAESLDKTVNLSELFSTLSEVKAMMATARLNLDKQVSANKTNLRSELVNSAELSCADHLKMVNTGLSEHFLSIPAPPMDGWKVIKGMSSFSNMESSLDDAVARFKIDADISAENVLTALAKIDKEADGYLFLFSDKASLVAMEPSHLSLHIESTIKKYTVEAQAVEQAKLAAISHNRETIENYVSSVEELRELGPLHATRGKLLALDISKSGDQLHDMYKIKAEALDAIDARIETVNLIVQNKASAAKALEGHTPLAFVRETETSATVTQGAAATEPNDLPGYADLDDDFGPVATNIDVSPIKIAAGKVIEGDQQGPGLRFYASEAKKGPSRQDIDRWLQTLVIAIS